MISSVGLVANPKLDARLVENIYRTLAREFEVFAEPVAAEKAGTKASRLETLRELGLVAVVGGDGTILWAIEQLQAKPTILGIRAGRLSYLAELDAEELEVKLRAVRNEGFSVDRRMMLSVEGWDALNDVVLVPKRPAALADFRIELEGEEMLLRADGLVVATPTGSTAHSLAFRGPVVHLSCEAIILTPIGPFAGAASPLVLPADSELRISAEEELNLLVDGRLRGEREEVVIRKSPREAKFARFSKAFLRSHLGMGLGGNRS